MGSEDNRKGMSSETAQFLFDLRAVTVFKDLICLQPLIYLAELGIQGKL
jgi:hypothetical protein